MVKFKCVNILGMALRNNQRYCVLDILRQSSLKEICDIVNKSQPHMDAEYLKRIILKNASFLLDSMIFNAKEELKNEQ